MKFQFRRKINKIKRKTFSMMSMSCNHFLIYDRSAESDRPNKDQQQQLLLEYEGKKNTVRKSKKKKKLIRMSWWESWRMKFFSVASYRVFRIKPKSHDIVSWLGKLSRVVWSNERARSLVCRARQHSSIGQKWWKWRRDIAKASDDMKNVFASLKSRTVFLTSLSLYFLFEEGKYLRHLRFHRFTLLVPGI